MKTSKIFIKSNYVKHTKTEWVYCDAELFDRTNTTFLHLISDNSEKDLQKLNSVNNSNGSSTLAQLYHSKFRNNKINIILNLSLFQSSEIKSVNFAGLSKFAIKLVPSGFLRSKKLYLLPDIEESLTEWCDVLTGFISKANNRSKIDSSVDTKNSSTLSSLQNPKINEKSNSPELNVEISLDDNDAYESSSQNEFYLVTVEPTQDSIKLNIKGDYILKLGMDSLDLLHVSSREIIHLFPYSSIRRFGAKENYLRLEAGRHCTTGNGSFIFSVKDAIRIAEKLKYNTRQMKLGQSSINNSCMTLSKSSVSEMSFDIEPKLYGTMKSGFQKSSEVSLHNSTKLPTKSPALKKSNIGGSFLHQNTNADYFSNSKEINKDLYQVTTPEIIPRKKNFINTEERREISKELISENVLVNKICEDKEVSLQNKNNNFDFLSDIKRTQNVVSNSEKSLINDASQKIILMTTDVPILAEPQEIQEYSEITEDKGTEIYSDEFISSNCKKDNIKGIINDLENIQDINQTEISKNILCSKILNDPLPVVEENESYEENKFYTYVKLDDPNGLPSALLNCTSIDSINSSVTFEKDSGPSSLFDNSALHFTSSSRSSTSISPTFNTLPISQKSSPSNYMISDSTYFKYRQLPILPIRTTPVLNCNSNKIESSSPKKTPNVSRSESTNSQKKSPPPILPKPKSKTAEMNIDQSSFREFDEMIKNLNLSPI